MTTSATSPSTSRGSERRARCRRPCMRKSPIRARAPESPPWTSNTSTRSATRSPTWRSAPSRYGGIFDYDRKALRLNEVNAALENPNVWNEPKRAQELGREKRMLDTVVQTIDHLTSNLSDNTELFEMSKADGDEAGLRAIEADAAK